MEQVFNAIAERLQENLPELSFIDEDYGQLEALDNDRDMYPLTFPAVLINMPSTEWQCIQGNSQKGVMTVQVRLCLDCYDDTHITSEPSAKIEERMQMVHSLHTLLQGFRPSDDGELIRTSSRFYTANHGIKVYETTYTLSVTDIITETTSQSKRLTTRIFAQVLPPDPSSVNGTPSGSL